MARTRPPGSGTEDAHRHCHPMFPLRFPFKTVRLFLCFFFHIIIFFSRNIPTATVSRNSCLEIEAFVRK